MLRIYRAIAWLLLSLSLTHCGIISNKGVDYKKSRTIPTLEVPPDLTSTSIEEELAIPNETSSNGATLSEYQAEQIIRPVATQTTNVLPLSEIVKIKRDGNMRWLEVQASPEQVWSKVRDFWLDQGFLLTQENPRTGIMVTEWKENRGDIPQDGLRKYIGEALDILYSSSTRDKFRIRLERRKAEITEIYLIHQGAEEVSQGDNFVWQGRPSNPDLEAEMLTRLMVFLGIEEKRARVLIAEAKEAPTERATLIREGGKIQLTIHDGFEQTWRRTGLALDRVGFAVEDRSRDEGVYFVRYIDPEKNYAPGFFASLFGSDEPPEQEYFIHLVDMANETQIEVLNRQKQVTHNSSAEKILILLHEQLK